MSSILKRVRETLYEANEDLEGDETETGDDYDDQDENDLDSESICTIMDEEGFCQEGAACADVEAGSTCPYILDGFDQKSCCNFTPISHDTSSFGDNT